MSDNFQDESDIAQEVCRKLFRGVGWGFPQAVFRIRIRKFLGLPDLLVRGTDLDLHPAVIKQKYCKKNLRLYCFVTF